jgi:hypothetical protein
MMSFIGYINKVMIEFKIYITSHVCIEWSSFPSDFMYLEDWLIVDCLTSVSKFNFVMLKFTKTFYYQLRLQVLSILVKGLYVLVLIVIITLTLSNSVSWKPNYIHIGNLYAVYLLYFTTSHVESPHFGTL